MAGLGLLQSWFFLALVSSVATGLLIPLSKAALGGLHPSIIMAIRIVGVLVIIAPVAILAYTKNEIGSAPKNIDPRLYAVLLAGVAVTAGVSWYAFYESLRLASSSAQSSASVTAINYTSLFIVMLVERVFRDGSRNLDRGISGFCA